MRGLTIILTHCSIRVRIRIVRILVEGFGRVVGYTCIFEGDIALMYEGIDS